MPVTESFQTYFYLPPLAKVSGGLAVLTQLASHLLDADYRISFVTSGKLPAGLKLPPAPLLQLAEVKGQTTDRWLVPEGWPNAMLPALNAKASCALYVQNWAFLHGCLPAGLQWSALPVRMLAVSSPVKSFIWETTGLDAKVIPPAIDFARFHAGVRHEWTPGDPVKIAWMPRKNKGLARQIRTIFEAIARTRNERLPEWLAIENVMPDEVANILRSCQIFLATGFPEGFGLPPLEAMACGCLVAGFTGMGGWDYMRQALPNGFQPYFELPDTNWGANGFYAADGDVWGAALALRAAHEMLLEDADMDKIRKSAMATAAWYSPSRQRQAILDIWQDTAFWTNPGQSQC